MHPCNKIDNQFQGEIRSEEGGYNIHISNSYLNINIYNVQEIIYYYLFYILFQFIFFQLQFRFTIVRG